MNNNVIINIIVCGLLSLTHVGYTSSTETTVAIQSKNFIPKDQIYHFQKDSELHFIYQSYEGNNTLYVNKTTGELLLNNQKLPIATTYHGKIVYPQKNQCYALVDSNYKNGNQFLVRMQELSDQPFANLKGTRIHGQASGLIMLDILGNMHRINGSTFELQIKQISENSVTFIPASQQNNTAPIINQKIYWNLSLPAGIIAGLILGYLMFPEKSQQLFSTILKMLHLK